MVLVGQALNIVLIINDHIYVMSSGREGYEAACDECDPDESKNTLDWENRSSLWEREIVPCVKACGKR